MGRGLSEYLLTRVVEALEAGAPRRTAATGLGTRLAGAHGAAADGRRPALAAGRGPCDHPARCHRGRTGPHDR